MRITTPAELHESHRKTVQDTLVPADATEAESRLRRFLEARSGGLTEWDQCFLDFLGQRRTQKLLSGKAGDGIEIVFCPQDASGYWLLESPEGARGKGFLDQHDTARVLGIARLKGLLAD